MKPTFKYTRLIYLNFLIWAAGVSKYLIYKQKLALHCSLANSPKLQSNEQKLGLINENMEWFLMHVNIRIPQRRGRRHGSGSSRTRIFVNYLP